MPSGALTTWLGTARNELDQLEAAHLAVGGAGPGRRYATQQVNDAYLVLVLAHFQRFCRDLHTEAAFFVAANLQSPSAEVIVQGALTRERQLDRVNPRPGAIGSDFALFGLTIWDALEGIDKRTKARNKRLEQLAIWRNAIAHQLFTMGPADAAATKGTSRTLPWIRTWRRVCGQLAEGMDRVVGSHLESLFGITPW